MGIYWYSGAYVGQMVCKTTLENIADKIPDRSTWVKQVDEDTFIVHPPRAHVRLSSIDPCLESHEVKRGYVYLKELVGALGEEASERLLHIPEDQRAAMTEISLAAFDASEHAAHFGSCREEGDLKHKRDWAAQTRMYVYQVESSTYDLPDTHAKLEYNIPVLDMSDDKPSCLVLL